MLPISIQGLQRFLDLLDVFPHDLLRLVMVLLLEGLKDLLMVMGGALNGGGRKGHGRDVAFQNIHDRVHGEEDHRVLRSLGDEAVKLDIQEACIPVVALAQALPGLRDILLDLLADAFLHPFARHFGRKGLQGQTDLGQVARLYISHGEHILQEALDEFRMRVTDEGAPIHSPPDFQDPRMLQRAQRFADRDPAGFKLLHELPLGGQFVAHLQFLPE